MSKTSEMIKLRDILSNQILWNNFNTLPPLNQTVVIKGSDFMGEFIMKAKRVPYKKITKKHRKPWRWQTEGSYGLRNLTDKETPEEWADLNDVSWNNYFKL